jgi:hypothetical protein
METSIEPDRHSEDSSAADDKLASGFDNAAVQKSFDDDVLDHVLNIYAGADTSSRSALKDNVNSNDNDGVNECDGNPTLGAVADEYIADDVFMCEVGTAGLLPGRLDVKPCDDAADNTEANEISGLDALDNGLTLTLRQRLLRTDTNKTPLPESYRDHRPDYLKPLECIRKALGAQVMINVVSVEIAPGTSLGLSRCTKHSKYNFYCILAR